MWEQFAHRLQGGDGYSLLGVGERDEAAHGSSSSADNKLEEADEADLVLQYEDLMEENKELRTIRQGLYTEVYALRAHLAKTDAGTIYADLSLKQTELQNAKNSISFLEIHNREQAENAKHLQASLLKAERDLEELRNEIVKIHPYKVQFMAAKHQLDNRDIEIVNLKREQRELLDKFQVMDSSRETLVIERQTQSAFILKLKYDIEKLSRINADNSIEMEGKDRRITQLEAEIVAKEKDILESDVVKELVEMKDQIVKENISLKKKYKQRDIKKNIAKARYEDCMLIDCGMNSMLQAPRPPPPPLLPSDNTIICAGTKATATTTATAAATAASTFRQNSSGYEVVLAGNEYSMVKYSPSGRKIVPVGNRGGEGGGERGGGGTLFSCLPMTGSSNYNYDYI